jgi:RNA polymerase sigma-70 factor (ECF subfamily)
MTTLLLHPTAYRTASDEQLVALVRAGDVRAFDAIHDRYEARLQAYARQLLGGAHHDAEEVVQDAFVRALRALRSDDREMALKAWLYTIVRNRALDVRHSSGLLRQRQHCQPVSLLPLGDPELSMDQRDRLHRVVDQIGHLPERERRALVLRAFEGRTHAELAARLDTSVPATKALVFRARAHLRHAERAAAA